VNKQKVISSTLIALVAVALVFSNVYAAVEPAQDSAAVVVLAYDASSLTDTQLKAAAKVLGISVSTLKGDLAEGLTLENIADNAGIDVRIVYDAIRRARSASDTSSTTSSSSSYYGYTLRQLKAIAAVLDISVDTLKGDLAEGLTLEDLANSASIDVIVLYNAMYGRSTPNATGGNLPPNSNSAPGGNMPPGGGAGAPPR